MATNTVALLKLLREFKFKEEHFESYKEERIEVQSGYSKHIRRIIETYEKEVEEILKSNYFVFRLWRFV